MTVKEAISLLAYGERYYLKGAKTGKMLHATWTNKKDHINKYLDLPVIDDPFFTDLYTNKKIYRQPYTYPVIGIWVAGE